MTYAIVVLSGGMDSTTALHHTLRAYPGEQVDAVSVDYGQRHARELQFARLTCDRLGVRHDVADLSDVGRLLTGSALTDDAVDVPHGHYAEPSMAATVVPNRNALLASAAAAVAVARQARLLVLGVHAGDHPIYPDCRPEFVAAFGRMLRVATEGYADVRVEAPFVHMPKHGIAALGDALGVDWTTTWSCYEGGKVHCGQCGTCVERIEAFDLAGVDDPTEYASRTPATV